MIEKNYKNKVDISLLGTFPFYSRKIPFHNLENALSFAGRFPFSVAAIFPIFTGKFLFFSWKIPGQRS
jgi:hypothetical protein